jgi:hypothetical protein
MCNVYMELNIVLKIDTKFNLLKINLNSKIYKKN